MLEFIEGGSPLTTAERQQAVKVVAIGMRSSPAKWQQTDAAEARALEQIAQNNEAYNNTLREAIRYTYVFRNGEANGLQPEFVIEKRIIEAHDPVIAIDAAHRRVVTAQMLPFIEQTAAWAAKEYGFAPPGTNFKAWVIADLQQQLATLDAPIAEGFAHIERNAWFAPKFFEQLPPAQRTAFFAKNRDATFHNLNDPHSEQWQIAEAGAMIAGFAAKRTLAQMGGQGGSGYALLNQQMQMKALQGAARSFSPACNVTVGSYASRAANGCYP